MLVERTTIMDKNEITRQDSSKDPTRSVVVRPSGGLSFFMETEMSSPKFVQLESAAFLTDVDFMVMSAAQRGVYCTLIFLLYCNNGKLEFNSPPNSRSLSILCSDDLVDMDIEIILKKFIYDGKYLTHKRVSAELQKVVDFQKYGRLGAEKRWKIGDSPLDTPAICPPNGNVSKVKESKDNINKDKYLEYVYLSKEEHQKLLDTFGESVLNAKLESLNNYIGSKGVKYKSHYHTILSWSRKDGGMGTPAPQKTKFQLSLERIERERNGQN